MEHFTVPSSPQKLIALSADISLTITCRWLVGTNETKWLVQIVCRIHVQFWDVMRQNRFSVRQFSISPCQLCISRTQSKTYASYCIFDCLIHHRPTFRFACRCKDTIMIASCFWHDWKYEYLISNFQDRATKKRRLFWRAPLLTNISSIHTTNSSLPPFCILYTSYIGQKAIFVDE